MGTTCRVVAVALIFGLDFLVATVRADPRASDFYIHGYSKLTQVAKHFVVCVAFVSDHTAAFSVGLLNDSRVPRRLLELEDTSAARDFILGQHQAASVGFLG